MLLLSVLLRLSEKTVIVVTYVVLLSFPGGMVNDGDGDSVETALRESEEELGLNMSDIDVWGSMLPLPYRVSQT